MNNILSKQIKVNGLDVHYFSGGQGAPLIVVHGGSDGAWAWLANMAELSQHYTIYVPDLPGFGHSQPIDGDYYIPELVDFVDDFAHEVGLESFHLMGHSLGGGVAAHYALKFPGKIKKLVLVSSLCLGKEIAWWVRLFTIRGMCRSFGKAAIAVFKGIKWLAEQFVGPVEWKNPISWTSIVLGTCVSTFKEQTMVLLEELSAIMVPTLVIWGGRDPIVPARQAYQAGLLIPDCQVKVFAGCGHSVYREKLPEFSRLLMGFLG